MMKFNRRVLRGPTLTMAMILAAMLALGLAGCSDDTLNGGPEPAGETATGVFHVDLGDAPADFEIISAKNGDPADPILGPMAIRGHDIRYEEGALVMDLSVENIGDESYDEPVKMTFLTLLPEGVTVLNPDNAENGAGAMIEFMFENDDAMWTPGEESLGREVRFDVDEGTAIGFVARLDAGDMDGAMGSLGGMVWNDENGDGVMDETEAGVPGVTLELSAEGMDAMTVMSGEDGTYAFDDLDAGFYSVRRLPVEGWVGTSAPQIYVVLVMDDGSVVSFMAANFGVKMDEGGDPMGVISGLVWNDLNGDGIKDEDEAGVEGIPVVLSGDASDTTATGADGMFAFEMLAAGSYEVVSLGPDGWSLTTDSPVQVVLPENDSVFDAADFGWMQDAVEPTGTISGVVFNDLNGDGMRDEGEAGVEGITVVLAMSDATKDLPDSTVTDADGMYGFDMLGAGAYVVTSLGPEGWTYTTGPLDVTLAADDSVVDDADHGWMLDMVEPTGTISGLVWNDLNGDGLVDDGEAGVEGIPVVLTAATKDLPDTTTSGADGTYAFDMLAAGSYEVMSLGPDGWSLTTDSPVAVTLEADDSAVAGVDFGWQEDSTGGSGFISGVVFNDLNGDGIKDDGEPGVEGITVDLTGAATATTVTSSEGVYSFLALGAGDYTVTSVGPEGWTYTTGPLSVKLETDASMATDADHGWQEGTTP